MMWRRRCVDMSVPQDALECLNSVSVTLMRIRTHGWRTMPATTEYDYPAMIIRDTGRILYYARGAIVPITEYEAQQVVRNPLMYYFSTALKLHGRIQRAIQDQ